MRHRHCDRNFVWQTTLTQIQRDGATTHPLPRQGHWPAHSHLLCSRTLLAMPPLYARINIKVPSRHNYIHLHWHLWQFFLFLYLHGCRPTGRPNLRRWEGARWPPTAHGRPKRTRLGLKGTSRQSLQTELPTRGHPTSKDTHRWRTAGTPKDAVPVLLH